jgi:hypothetical protein
MGSTRKIVKGLQLVKALALLTLKPSHEALPALVIPYLALPTNMLTLMPS